MNADEPRTKTGRQEFREELDEWAPYIGWGTVFLVALGLTIAFLVFVIGHYQSITGAAFWILKWAFVILIAALVAVALVAAVVVLTGRTRIIVEKNPSIIPNTLAAFATAVLGGATNDLVFTTKERVLWSCVLGVLAFIGSELFRKSKLWGIVLLLFIPAILVGLFFKMPLDKQRSWLHEQGLSGFVNLGLIVVVLAVGLVMARFLDKEK
jgi:hypothetical protein